LKHEKLNPYITQLEKENFEELVIIINNIIKFDYNYQYIGQFLDIKQLCLKFLSSLRTDEFKSIMDAKKKDFISDNFNEEKIKKSTHLSNATLTKSVYRLDGLALASLLSSFPRNTIKQALLEDMKCIQSQLFLVLSDEEITILPKNIRLGHKELKKTTKVFENCFERTLNENNLDISEVVFLTIYKEILSKNITLNNTKYKDIPELPRFQDFISVHPMFSAISNAWETFSLREEVLLNPPDVLAISKKINNLLSGNSFCNLPKESIYNRN